MGIGLHTGPLIMGIIGDKKRSDPATIADSVNTASRLEGMTKHYGVKILLSGESLHLLKLVCLRNGRLSYLILKKIRRSSSIFIIKLKIPLLTIKIQGREVACNVSTVFLQKKLWDSPL